ncbi:MAG: hypothetical protein ACKO38_02980, partial [Planctomycetota bacterium]
AFTGWFSLLRWKKGAKKRTGGVEKDPRSLRDTLRVPCCVAWRAARPHVSRAFTGRLAPLRL